MTQSMDDFVADLRRLVAQWEVDAAQFHAMGEAELANQIEAWIVDARRIIETHGAVHA